MMEECVEETSEESSWCRARRLPMAPGSEPGPEAGEPSARSPGDAARRGGVARPSPLSADARAARLAPEPARFECATPFLPTPIRLLRNLFYLPIVS